MLIRSLVIAATVATLGLSSSAFAQSFSRSDGTGNNLPAYYDNEGSLQHGVAPQSSTLAAAPGRGLYAHHAVPGGRRWIRN